MSWVIVCMSYIHVLRVICQVWYSHNAYEICRKHFKQLFHHYEMPCHRIAIFCWMCSVIYLNKFCIVCMIIILFILFWITIICQETIMSGLLYFTFLQCTIDNTAIYNKLFRMIINSIDIYGYVFDCIAKNFQLAYGDCLSICLNSVIAQSTTPHVK